MSSSSRNIALAGFCLLCMLAGCALAWYIVAGHSWNVVASNIDDTIGSMEGYTAIVYEGLEQPDPQADSAGAGSYPPPVADPSVPDEALTVDAVRESYEDKGATVLVLDVANPKRYEDGVILKRGSKRFGVFSVDTTSSSRRIQQHVAFFSDHGVDFVVAVTPSKAYVEKEDGIDIVVSTQDEGMLATGEVVGQTFYADAVEEGAACAIVVSPSNVVSSKTIEEL